MKIRYICQPLGSRMCGQTVLAMLLNRSVVEICEEMDRYFGTYNKDIKRILDNYEIKYTYKRCNSFKKVPKNSIVKIKFGVGHKTHWTFKYGKMYYDPDIGIIKKYSFNISPVSYLSLQLINK